MTSVKRDLERTEREVARGRSNRTPAFVILVVVLVAALAVGVGTAIAFLVRALAS
jgi:hypothetical protein